VVAYNAGGQQDDALGPQDDAAAAALVLELAAWAQQRLGAPPAATRLFLAGHSRGAKLAALAALAAAQPGQQQGQQQVVAGLVLLDPVDASYEQIPGCAPGAGALLAPMLGRPACLLRCT
jgi:pimeloyl-ACP methyl ester carboxylesterase